MQVIFLVKNLTCYVCNTKIYLPYASYNAVIKLIYFINNTIIYLSYENNMYGINLTYHLQVSY